MDKTQAIDFMMFSLLGVTCEANGDLLIRAAINRAFRDAFSRVASLEEKTRTALTDEMLEAVKAYGMQCTDKCSDKQVFDCWHENLCSVMTNNGGESYGIAQKWVNMTLKYILMIRAVLNNLDYRNDDFCNLDVLKAEDYFHIPVDGYVAEALCRLGEEDENDSRPMPLKKDADGSVVKLSLKVSEYANPYESCIKSWSTWNADDYKLFRRKLDGRYDLNWEDRAWLLVAQYREKIEGAKGKEAKKDLREELCGKLEKI